MNAKTLLNNLSEEIGIELRNINDFEYTQLSFAGYKTEKPITPADFAGIMFRTQEQDKNYYRGKQTTAFYQLEGQDITSIVLINAGLETIPGTIFEIKKLKRLVLNSNWISAIDYRIHELSELEFLDLSNNRLIEWPESLKQLKYLLALDLSYNKLRIIPPEIKKLERLSTLFLSGNRIKEIPSSILDIVPLWQAHDLLFQIRTEKNLLIKNQKYDEAVPYKDKELLLFKELRVGFYAFDCQISNLPPEILSRNSESIKEYWKSLEISKHQPLNEVKIILVGEGGSGKTSLLKRLTLNAFDQNESQTHGINIKE
jgi:internalin A